MSRYMLLALAGLLTTLTVGVRWQPRPGPPPGADEAAGGDQQEAEPPPAFAGSAGAFLARHCVRCHRGPEAAGGVSLGGLLEDRAGVRSGLWRRAARAVRSGRMPPPGEARPAEEEVAGLDRWPEGVVGQGDARPGAVHRLNRAEYDNTVRDLVGIDFHPAAEFPADDVGHGFDNVGDVLAVPPILIEKYLAAAEQVVERLFQTPAARHRLLNPPPADAVPFGLRGMPPVRDEPRKVLRLAPADGPEIPNADQRALDQAGVVLRVFADRAYRRPVRYDELGRLVGFVEASQKAGEGTEPGLKVALQAVLVSPHFLFKVEHGGPTPGPAAGDFALASRLSYFLWSSMPDRELFALAARGALRDGPTLRNQVRRMLWHPRSRALARNFAGQWLQTRALKDLTPDPVRFPDFDEGLRRAMAEETARLFDFVVREDRRVLDLLDADYTFVNERLARHYGIPGVSGGWFRRVSLSGTGRGGVLTHAAVLSLTSNPTRTSPVKRGRWVLENLLGAETPPPPPGADGLLAAGAAGGTLRQRLERHRSDAACASCHRHLDPLGFALENFDAVGAWRSHDGGSPIDASGEAPDGRRIDGPAGLRDYLRSRAVPFRRCLAEKLLTYALGRGLRRADRLAVDAIARRLARGDRFSQLAIAIVQSKPFLQRPPEGGPP